MIWKRTKVRGQSNLASAIFSNTFHLMYLIFQGALFWGSASKPISVKFWHSCFGIQAAGVQ